MEANGPKRLRWHIARDMRHFVARHRGIHLGRRAPFFDWAPYGTTRARGRGFHAGTAAGAVVPQRSAEGQVRAPSGTYTRPTSLHGKAGGMAYASGTTGVA